MANARNTSEHIYRRLFVRLWRRIDALYDLFFSDANKAILRQVVIWLGISGFAFHVALIFLARSDARFSWLVAAVGQNYLTAISTPFNIILFYEVLTLISALPASTTRSLANQFEIVSLIFIREVFTDIADANDLISEHKLSSSALPAFLDMWGGLLMFFLVGVFQYIAQQRAHPAGTAISPRGAARFTAQKKVVSIGLGILLMGMAAYNLGLIFHAIHNILLTGHGSIESATTFYNDLFTVMIFTDVLILILSMAVSGHYAMVFRNAAFVVSTILIRFSLTEGYPFGAPLAVMAMAFGILTLLVYNYHLRLEELPVS